jgi:CO dehydrogenase maturation factor
MTENVKRPILERRKRIFAICGKGGVGKTAFSAMLTRVLLENGKAGKLLVIDADPALGLTNALNMHVEKTIGQVREAIITTAKERKDTELTEMVGTLDYMVMEALSETETLALLAMGRSETLGCFCSVNNLLRDAVKFLSQTFDTIVIDGEAGLEQINRQVMGNLDVLIIISDATSRGIQTGALIRKMVEDEKVIQCQKMGLVFNRVSGNEDLLNQYAREIGVEVFGCIPHDENITQYDLVGKPLLELPDTSSGLSAVRDIVENFILL